MLLGKHSLAMALIPLWTVSEKGDEYSYGGGSLKVTVNGKIGGIEVFGLFNEIVSLLQRNVTGSGDYVDININGRLRLIKSLTKISVALEDKDTGVLEFYPFPGVQIQKTSARIFIAPFYSKAISLLPVAQEESAMIGRVKQIHLFFSSLGYAHLPMETFLRSVALSFTTEELAGMEHELGTKITESLRLSSINVESIALDLEFKKDPEKEDGATKKKNETPEEKEEREFVQNMTDQQVVEYYLALLGEFGKEGLEKLFGYISDAQKKMLTQWGFDRVSGKTMPALSAENIDNISVEITKHNPLIVVFRKLFRDYIQKTYSVALFLNDKEFPKISQLNKMMYTYPLDKLEQAIKYYATDNYWKQRLEQVSLTKIEQKVVTLIPKS